MTGPDTCTACGHRPDQHSGPGTMCRAADNPPGVTCKCYRYQPPKGGGVIGSRTIPTECEHGIIVDWGDFGPNPDDSREGLTPCVACAEARKIVDPLLIAVIEEALVGTLPYVDSFHLGDVAIAVAEQVWAWLAEGDLA